MASVMASQAPLVGPPSMSGLIKRLRAFTTCDVGDTLIRLGDKRGAYLYGLSPMVPGTPTEPGKPWNICGKVVTIRMCPYGGGLGPKLKPFVEYNEAGKIMVIETPDGQSGKYSACWGGIESLRAKIIGAQGVIVSGNMREVDDCREVGLPVLSRGVAALGAKQFMRLGKVNELITINGIKVRPDDVVLADAHGAVVVQKIRLEKVIEMCELRAQQKRLVRKDIENRKTMGDAIEHVRRRFGDPYDTFERNPRSIPVSTA